MGGSLAASMVRWISSTRHHSIWGFTDCGLINMVLRENARNIHGVITMLRTPRHLTSSLQRLQPSTVCAVRKPSSLTACAHTPTLQKVAAYMRLNEEVILYENNVTLTSSSVKNFDGMTTSVIPSCPIDFACRSGASKTTVLPIQGAITRSKSIPSTRSSPCCS